MKDEFSFDDFLLSDNYDFLIYNMLKMLLEDNDGIQFLDTDPFEAILSINGTKILVTHGTNVKKDTQQSIQQIVGKHAIKGDIIDYIIFGHIHFANITDLYSRSGSLVGGNTYSERELNLATIASQVIHFVDDNGDIHNYRVNLQNTDGYDGYSISNDYDAYNPQLSNYKKRSKVINL
jgi:DNA repair exonuclease SbcCD nuclease subunit